ncbi:FAD-binding oxidoreductase [Catenuloplanes indicus]|uniref:FAD/FMN-containing dehydrogenase n=1 Tax=Catenuloplanes indicus TaxID=137267 RepID=A0AAE3VVJ7_9ACTN|nr:FAD-binding protein [Catenuloplanes indicus]MDQ0365038.1 FAD/FMN-containing dehydrogenase [Catenuloplanes indicus]
MRHLPVSRRALLGGGVALGTAALLAGCGTETAPAGARLLRPGDPGYDAAVSSFNLNQIPRPGTVVQARTADDVRTAVGDAAARRAPVGVLATGHQPSSPIGEDAVLITTRAMRGVTINAGRRVARVEAGALWGHTLTAALQQQLVPLHGSTGTVGVVGYTLGGGLSPLLGRVHGYAADHVLAIDVVGADGELRTVTASSDPELFFGLRGGKSNFGIVTAMEFGLFPVPPLYGGAIMFDGADGARVLHTYREWVRTVPETMSSSVALLRLPDLPQVPEPLRGKLVANVRIAFTGPASEAAALIAPLRAAATPLRDQVAQMPWSGYAAIHSDPTSPTPAYERTALLRDLSEDAVDALLAAAGPDAPAPVTAVEIRHLGGALARPPQAESAVSHRDAAFTLFIAGVGGPEQAGSLKEAAAGIVRAMQPWSTGGMYVNFMNTDDTSPESVRQAYRPEVYGRLLALKKRVDPDNMFRLNHNIVD